MDDLELPPCPQCGENTLTLVMREHFIATTKPFSLAGAQLKIPVTLTRWPWLVCSDLSCGFVERGKIGDG